MEGEEKKGWGRLMGRIKKRKYIWSGGWEGEKALFIGLLRKIWQPDELQQHIYLESTG